MNNESQPFKSLNISILIISDTRTVSSDKSGKILEDIIKESGHNLISKLYVKDEPALIKKEISKDLEDNWSVVAEVIQTILRREGYEGAYEELKDLTRKNEKINQF